MRKLIAHLALSKLEREVAQEIEKNDLARLLTLARSLERHLLSIATHIEKELDRRNNWSTRRNQKHLKSLNNILERMNALRLQTRSALYKMRMARGGLPN